MTTHSPWLFIPHPQPDARVRLFCFPHGGGGPAAYRDWPLPAWVEIVAVSPPGRGMRHSEPAVTDMAVFTAALLDALPPLLDKPFALFGHSVGALTAYACAHALAQRGLPSPLRLMVSGLEAPGATAQASMHGLDDAALLRAVTELGLLPAAVIEGHQELRELILTPLRADYALAENYPLPADPTLAVPLLALGGTRDPLVSAPGLEAWRDFTTAAFHTVRFAGDHFFTISQLEGVCQTISEYLQADLAAAPRAIAAGPGTDYPRDACLHELFSAQAARSPEAPALVDAHCRLSYRTLEEESDLLARYLLIQGAGVERIVGIAMHHHARYVVAMLAILKAGAGYLPLDPAWPANLLQRVLAKAQPVAVLADSANVAGLPEDWPVSGLASVECSPDEARRNPGFLDPGFRRASSGLHCRQNSRVLVLDEGWQTRLANLELPPLSAAARPGADNLAYVVTTSGTTGEPKVILCPHRGAVNSYFWRYRHLPYQAGEREACNVFFVWEVLRPLLQGATAVVIPDELIADPHGLVAFLAEHRITRVLFTPSLLEQVLHLSDAELHQRLAALRVVMLNGEVVTGALAARCQAHLPQVRLLNDYSISECHDICGIVLEAGQASPRFAPVGPPMDNVRIYVLDAAQQPVPVGVAGEIYVGGDNLALGYLDDPEQTAERFISLFGQRLFRTGDRGRLLRDGQLEISGRLAFMIKLRGYTVVPGAVESVIRRYPGVSACVVEPRLDAESAQPDALVAYVVPKPAATAPGAVAPRSGAGRHSHAERGNEMISRLRRHLQTELPHYAIPAYFILLDALPVSPATGKLDRRQLPPSPACSRRVVHLFAPSSTTPKADDAALIRPTSISLATLWENLLGIAPDSPEANFFELGGHSLLAAELSLQIEQHFGCRLSVVDIFSVPTLAQMQQFIERQPVRSTQTAATDSHHQPIAIIGMAGRYPGAEDIERFWQNLVAGKESLHRFSDEELRANGVPEDLLQHPDYVKVGACVADAETFDAAFWGLSEREAILMDPQHRLFLQACWEALEQAGYPPRHTRPLLGRTGVFAGCYLPTYLLHALHGGGLMDAADPAAFHITETGNDKDYLTSRVSYLLDLDGPSVAVQTSCSTGLTAVATACQALRGGECDAALAGAASLTFPRGGYRFVEGHINSRSGQCRSFDAQADGTVLGEGVGVVVLRRLRDALAARDPIIAVIKGFAVNNDAGARGGYSAPGVQGQAAVIRQALATAGVNADRIGLVEAHGTATQVGDPIEVQALREAFQGAERCVLGSLKPNIGHANIAAGIAGLSKAALSLYHGMIPPTLHFETPNPALRLEESPFWINREALPWPAGDQPRRAGVSSFGIGGTNCHVILEEAPAFEKSPPAPLFQRGEVNVAPLFQRGEVNVPPLWQRGGRGDLSTSMLLPLSAKTPQALQANRQRLHDFLRDNPRVSLADVAWTLQTGREHFRYRLAVSAHDIPSARQALAKNLAPVEADLLHPPQPVFLFPGQGAHHPAMGADLYHGLPRFRRHADDCLAQLAKGMDTDLRPFWLAPPDAPEAERLLSDARLLQPALFTVEYALARTLMDYGMHPVALAGHSLGEYPAAVLAGVLSLAEASELVTVRAAAMHKAAAGAMVALSEAETETWLRRHPQLSLALANSPRDSVLSGPAAAVAALEADLARANLKYRRLDVTGAFHSPLMAAAAAALHAHAATLQPAAPRIPMTANLTGTWLSAAQARDPGYWGRQLRHTVRFADNLRTLLEAGHSVFVEAGPNRTLATLLHRTAAHAELNNMPVMTQTMRHPREQDQSDVSVLMNALGRWWCLGGNMAWEALYEDTPRRIALPGYAFAQQRYWPASGACALARQSPEILPLEQRCFIPSWKRTLLPSQGLDALEPSAFLLFDAPHSPVAQALQQAGHTVIRCHSPADMPACLHQWQTTPAGHHRLLYLWAWDATDTEAFAPWLQLAQNLVTQTIPAAVWLVTHGLVQVHQESVVPAKSVLLGPALVLPQENPRIACRILDVEAGEVARIVRECTAPRPGPEPLIARRGPHRWAAAYEPIELPAVPLSPWQAGDVYLITGGLGRIGLSLAHHLAHRGARLILTTRGDGDPEKLRALQAGGAEILLISGCDLSRAADVRRVFQQAHTRFGRIDGIFHAAGVAQLRYLPELSEEIVAREFGAKIHAVRHLHANLTGLQDLSGFVPPRFVVLFSSLAAVLGGLGMAAYTAANAFMDAFATAAARDNTRWLSINWDDWDYPYSHEQVGAYAKTQAQFALPPAEGIELLERLSACPEISQALVSMRPLTTRLEQWWSQARRGQEQETSSAPAAGDLESVVKTVYRQVLGKTHIHPDDDFFHLGGDSLSAVQISMALRDRGLGSVPIAAVFDYPSVRKLAEWLA